MILVDSDVLIAHLRGVEAARDWLADTSRTQEIAISALTITEISAGMRSAQRRQVWELLTSLTHEPVSYSIARRAGELSRTWGRSNVGIGIVDYLIAATAQERGYPLATLNTRHYPMLPEVFSPFTLASPKDTDD